MAHEHDDVDRVTVTVDYGRLAQALLYMDASILLIQKEREELTRQLDKLGYSITKEEDNGV